MTLIRVAAVVLLGSGAAHAQMAPPPGRIANQANGLSYQPTLGGVTEREQSAGINPSHSQLSNEDRELNEINRQLLGDKAKPPIQNPTH